jgi:hypothetical protein
MKMATTADVPVMFKGGRAAGRLEAGSESGAREEQFKHADAGRCRRLTAPPGWRNDFAKCGNDESGVDQALC